MEYLHPKTTGQNWQQSSSSSSSHSTSPSSSSDKSRDYSYYAYLEESINNKAKKLTAEYLRSGRGGNSLPLQEQTFLVYKFIHTPIDAIIAGM